MSSPATQMTTLEPTLTKKLILHYNPKVRMNQDAVLTANELLRLFIVEARQRAAVEAECENEADASLIDGSEELHEKIGTTEDTIISIRGDHVTKIAAELLMDFS